MISLWGNELHYGLVSLSSIFFHEWIHRHFSFNQQESIVLDRGAYMRSCNCYFFKEIRTWKFFLPQQALIWNEREAFDMGKRPSFDVFLHRKNIFNFRHLKHPKMSSVGVILEQIAKVSTNIIDYFYPKIALGWIKACRSFHHSILPSPHMHVVLWWILSI